MIVPPKGGALRDRLLARFDEGVTAPWTDEDFDALARDVFAHQFQGNAIYRRFCEQRGQTPATVEHWTEVPAVAARAFKTLDLLVGHPAECEAVFRTSGTSSGASNRGTHWVRDLTLYHGSALPNFQAHLLPDDARLPLISLVASAKQSPESSLAHMVDAVATELCAEGGGAFFDPELGLDVPALEEALASHSVNRQPVLIVGTAFSFVHWLDDMAERGVRFRLPTGTRLMETGGFKGRSRAVDRPDLYAALVDRLGVPDHAIVNEYGMTELLSQYYEPVLRGANQPRVHRGPPWLRARVLDPDTLTPVPAGTPGLVQHFDLANLESVACVLTEDMGIFEDGGLSVLGRAKGAELRGCSLTLDELLSSTDSGV